MSRHRFTKRGTELVNVVCDDCGAIREYYASEYYWPGRKLTEHDRCKSCTQKEVWRQRKELSNAKPS